MLAEMVLNQREHDISFFEQNIVFSRLDIDIVSSLWTFDVEAKKWINDFLLVFISRRGSTDVRFEQSSDFLANPSGSG